VVLTLPIAEVLKREIPGTHLTFCVQHDTADLVRMSPFIDDILEVKERDLTTGFQQFSRILHARQFDAAIFAYPRPRLAFAAWLAGIQIRVGTGFRWYSFLFNRRISEHRSDARFHERDYNLHLLRPFGFPETNFPNPSISISETLRIDATTLLRNVGIPENTSFVILHPGSGGSAKEWSSTNFGLLGKEILRQYPNMMCLITGSKSETELVNRVRGMIGGKAVVIPRELSLPELAAIISLARIFVSNSTGPLHIAAAVRIPLLAFYPFQRECHPHRWGPLSAVQTILMPERNEACSDCLRGNCDQHDDMERINLELALQAFDRMMGNGSERNAVGSV